MAMGPGHWVRFGKFILPAWGSGLAWVVGVIGFVLSPTRPGWLGSFRRLDPGVGWVRFVNREAGATRAAGRPIGGNWVRFVRPDRLREASLSTTGPGFPGTLSLFFQKLKAEPGSIFPRACAGKLGSIRHRRSTVAAILPRACPGKLGSFRLQRLALAALTSEALTMASSPRVARTITMRRDALARLALGFAGRSRSHGRTGTPTSDPTRVPDPVGRPGRPPVERRVRGAGGRAVNPSEVQRVGPGRPTTSRS